MGETVHALQCDGWCGHANPATMLGSKGYLYCGPCGLQRRASGYEKVRKLTPAEIRRIERGETLQRY